MADDVGAVLGATVLASGSVIVATSRGTLVAIDAAGSPRTSFVHDGWAWAVTPYGDAVASCGEDGVVIVTDRHGHARPLAELDGSLRALVALPAGDLLVGDTRGWLFQLATDGSVVASWRAHRAAITSIAAAEDGRWATGSEDGTVKQWRAGREIGVARARDFVTSVAFDARGALVCAGYDGSIWLASGDAPQ